MVDGACKISSINQSISGALYQWDLPNRIVYYLCVSKVVTAHHAQGGKLGFDLLGSEYIDLFGVTGTI